MSSAPPQFSPDGKWWWDGTKWVPAAQAPPTAGDPLAPSWPVVQTDAGPVTVASLAELQARIGSLAKHAEQLKQQAAGLQGEADRAFRAAGAILVARRTDWTPPAELQPAVTQAAELSGHAATDQQKDQALKAAEAGEGFFAKVGAHHAEHDLERDQEHAQRALDPLLIQIGRAAAASGISQAEEHRSQGAGLDAKSTALTQQGASATAEAGILEQQVTQRQEALKNMGFDALYETAVLQTSGPQPVESPLVLKAGEHAYEAAPASLARMTTSTRYVGGSSGFSFPIGHTGIRYRVGSYRGHPVQQESLKHLDSGTLVVTNQRLAYVGATKSMAIPLPKILHVEVYNDGISVAHEGRENPDFFLVSQPKHVVFLLNWFLRGS